MLCPCRGASPTHISVGKHVMRDELITAERRKVRRVHSVQKEMASIRATLWGRVRVSVSSVIAMARGPVLW
jgi:hypothetical protein